MRSKIVAAVVLAALALVSVPAFAHGADGAKFPMPAAAFKQKVDKRTAKARERMEHHASKRSPEEAKVLRAKFDAGVAQLNQEVAKATQDGTVTKDEVDKVRAVAKAIRPHHGKGKHARKGKRAPEKK